MSRHRNVRSMNYQDEYDGYDDVYGHSVEDDYCVSPSTASQFLYDRGQKGHDLSTYMSPEPNIPEENEEQGEEEKSPTLDSSSSFSQPQLSDVQQAQLFSCMEQIHNILGDSTPEHILKKAIIEADFDYQKVLNSLLNKQEAPKLQREPRANRRNREARPPATQPLQQKEPDPFQAAAPTITLAAPAPRQGAEVTQGVARLTFSAKSQVTKGFTEVSSSEAKAPTASEKVSGREDVKPQSSDPFYKDSQPIPGSSRDAAPCSITTNGPSSAAEASAGFVTPKKGEGGADTSAASTPTPSSAKKSKADLLSRKKEYEKRKAEGKDNINLVVVGHVDAGKSTLMGHVLYQLGFVNKRLMHKYEQDSKKLGKASFAYAWVLDETEEERARGVTMDIAQTRFETPTKVVTLLDAPGHKDFIPNMITGAAQADVAILVVNATTGEFETGFEAGGQTREHAMLIRSLGVSQLLVAINKMDTVEWAQARFEEITKKLRSFLKQAGFKDSDVVYVPCSGLVGENLTKPGSDTKLTSWYSGPHVAHQIDLFKPPERPVDRPLRYSVADIFKGQGTGFSVSGTVQAGCVQAGDKVLVMPQGEMATVKSLSIDELPYNLAFAGDNVTLTLTGIEMNNIGIGSILCDAADPITATSRLQARVVIFNIDVPITRGYPVVFHFQSLTEPASIRRLISQLHKTTGEVVKNKPRCLVKNSNAVVEIELERPTCVELYRNYKDLGRFMLRSAGHTIAAGLVTEITNTKSRTS